jgi:DHA1 family bicyclomycin/chloramphenicol resistance-like MFS transporter
LSCFALAFGGGGFLLYVATAPDVVLNIFHLSETQFGWLFVPLISGLILGSAVGAKLMGRISPARLARVGFGLMAAGAAVNIAASLWLAPRVPWAVLPLTLYTFGFSFVAPVVTIEGLDMIPQRKGLAASLQGFTQILVFALIQRVLQKIVVSKAAQTCGQIRNRARRARRHRPARHRQRHVERRGQRGRRQPGFRENRPP